MRRPDAGIARARARLAVVLACGLVAGCGGGRSQDAQAAANQALAESANQTSVSETTATRIYRQDTRAARIIRRDPFGAAGGNTQAVSP